jgi:hypothetical protein
MSGSGWSQDWFDGGVTQLEMLAWRGVESQHIVSTLRLVDTSGEQEMLEKLLEVSKPPAPVMKVPKHYLIFTPFRYRPEHSSRFRPAGSLGLWYGAENLFAACAEVAYWRNRFVLESAGLVMTDVLTVHTFYQARVDGLAVDLMSPPWVAARDEWMHGADYSQTHALAEAARNKGVQWICYESVRAEGNRCAAVLDVEAVDMVSSDSQHQTWQCKTNRSSVMMQHGSECFVWNF